jgi:O-antigen ligase
MAAPAAASPARMRPLTWAAGGALLMLLTAVSASGLAVHGLIVLLGGLALALCVVRPELGVLALVSTFFLSYPAMLEGAGRLTPNNVLGLVLGAVLAVRMAVERKAEFLRDRYVHLFLLIGVAVLVNQALTDPARGLPAALRGDSGGERVDALITRFAFLVFFLSFIRTRAHALLVTGCLVLFTLMTAPGAIQNAVGATGKIERIRASADFGIVSAGNANRLAFFCAVAIAILAHALMAYRSRIFAVAGGLAIALCVTTIFFTASRSGLVELAALSAILVGRRHARARSRWLALLALALAVGLGVLLVPPAYLDRITNFTSTEALEEGGDSLLKHQTKLLVGLRMIPDHPLVGVGLGNYRGAAFRYSGYYGSPHNSYLLMAVEGGLILLVPYLLLFGYAWRDLRRTRRLAGTRDDVNLGWLVDAVQTILVLFLVASLFADLWYEVILYVIIGLAAVLGRLHRTAPAGVP